MDESVAILAFSLSLESREVAADGVDGSALDLRLSPDRRRLRCASLRREDHASDAALENKSQHWLLQKGRS